MSLLTADLSSYDDLCRAAGDERDHPEPDAPARSTPHRRGAAMLEPLTPQGHFECGLEAIVANPGDLTEMAAQGLDARLWRDRHLQRTASVVTLAEEIATYVVIREPGQGGRSAARRSQSRAPRAAPGS